MNEKLPAPSKGLVEKYDRLFAAQAEVALKGDGRPDIQVVDLRSSEGEPKGRLVGAQERWRPVGYDDDQQSKTLAQSGPVLVHTERWPRPCCGLSCRTGVGFPLMNMRYPLPRHSMHSLPSRSPEPRQGSHGAGSFSFIRFSTSRTLNAGSASLTPQSSTEPTTSGTGRRAR